MSDNTLSSERVYDAASGNSIALCGLSVKDWPNSKNPRYVRPCTVCAGSSGLDRG